MRRRQRGVEPEPVAQVDGVEVVEPEDCFEQALDERIAPVGLRARSHGGNLERADAISPSAAITSRSSTTCWSMTRSTPAASNSRSPSTRSTVLPARPRRFISSNHSSADPAAGKTCTKRLA